jgi:hypothetical protein
MSDTNRNQPKDERAIMIALIIAAGLLAIALIATIVFRS